MLRMARAQPLDAATGRRRPLAPPREDAPPRTLGEAFPLFLRHGSPRILIAALSFALAARFALGGWSRWDAAPVAATLVYWPLQEWAIHVFILHARPRRLFGRSIDLRVPRKHRAHHREPWRPELLFIPMHSFLYTLPLLLALWLAAAPTRPLALSGICCHLALTLHYEWVHFLVHTRVSPRSRLYQRLWKNHRRHHFKNEHYWFGVTMLAGDRLLGTAPAFQDVPTSPTARSLEGVRPGAL